MMHRSAFLVIFSAMKRSTLSWILSAAITVAAAWYQRATGPTHPLPGSYALGDRHQGYELPRSHTTGTDCVVAVPVPDTLARGILMWRHFPSSEAWRREVMVNSGGMLSTRLPDQPPAGHLEYAVMIQSGGSWAVLPSRETAVIRFKGEVPLLVLIPHILAMFLAMLLSTRTGLACFDGTAYVKPFIGWTIGFLVLGGFVLGPLVQRAAFGSYWTGWPAGSDLTDPKTLFALVLWLFAALAVWRFRNPRRWVAVAATALLLVYLIPHSALGSRLEYGTALPQSTPETKKTPP